MTLSELRRNLDERTQPQPNISWTQIQAEQHSGLRYRPGLGWDEADEQTIIIPPGNYQSHARLLAQEIAPEIRAWRRIQAGEQLYAGDALVERNGLFYRAETTRVWRPVENCPHFWIPREYSLPSECSTATEELTPVVPPPSVARMAEIMQCASMNMGINFPESREHSGVRANLLQAAAVRILETAGQGIDWSLHHPILSEVTLQEIAEYDELANEAQQMLDNQVEDFTQAALALGEIAADTDRETVGADDLDALFAKIDEVINDGD